MPLVNVIRGETIPAAPLNVRTPVLDMPVGMFLAWWVLKGIAIGLVAICRYWYVTAPVLVMSWLYVRFGWAAPVLVLIVFAALSFAWWYRHRTSFLSFIWFPALARYRYWWYSRRWYPAMATAKLAVSFNGDTVIPILKRVRCRPGADELHVRMVTGHIPDDYAKVSERLAHTFGARVVRAVPGRRPDLVVLVVLRGDPLAQVVAPLPVPAIPDFTALPVGKREDGGTYMLRLFGTQVLIVGATGAGKGSVIWSLIRSLAGGIAAGVVQVWAFDPKGGMELGAGEPLFTRFACKDYAAMADMLEHALTTTQQRASRLKGRTRQHIPTTDEPLIVLIIDELAALTAYVTDRTVKD